MKHTILFSAACTDTSIWTYRYLVLSAIEFWGGWGRKIVRGGSEATQRDSVLAKGRREIKKKREDIIYYIGPCANFV